MFLKFPLSPNYVEKTKTKQNADIFADDKCGSINATCKSSMFPNSSKLTSVTPLRKKDIKYFKENYGSVSILQT